MVTLEELVRRLDEYWRSVGCAILEPYDMPVGAGTMHPATTLRCLGPEDWNVAYVQPSRRPADGRYTRNPMRSQRYYQYQIVLKPSPDNVVDLYMKCLDAVGFDTNKHDVRLVEDDWESQAAGAAGVGWEVWLDGTEITQFTFFQQMGGIECNPVCAEITLGLERWVLMLNRQNSFWEDLMWNDAMSYKKVDFQLEMQSNIYNFEIANTDMLFQMFDLCEAESKRTIESECHWDKELGILQNGKSPYSAEEAESLRLKHAALGDGPNWLAYPALDLALQCSHIFNLLDARGAISVSQRAEFINRIRARVRAACLKHVEQFKTAASK